MTTPRLLPVTLLTAIVFLLPAGAQTLYVSTQGRTGWSGRLAAPNPQGTDGPLPSLAAARDAVRGLKGKGPVTVLVRGGLYRLEEPLVFTPEDSGSPERPIVYAAYPGETPSISGGRAITGWNKGSGGVWTAEVPGVKEGRWYFRQLHVNGARAQRARTPTNGFYRIQGPSSQDKPFLLKFRGQDIRKAWEGTDAEVVALLAWAELRMFLTRVDEQAGLATLSGDPRPSNREVEARYYVENTPDGLDAPGEWYLDRASGILSYRPASGDDMTRAEVIAPVLNQLVRLEGQPEKARFVRHITFRGLRFCHSGWDPGERGYADTQAAVASGAVFEATGAEDVAIEQCAFAHHGQYAVWFRRGSRRCRVVRSEILDMGAGGIKLGETQQFQNPDEQNSGHQLTDNHIHQLGLVYPAAVGVWIAQSSQNVVAHNHIHDLHYTAISAGWTWGYGPNQSKGHRIEYNHLHHIHGQPVLSDLAGIYTLGVQPGTVLRYNLIHDIDSFTYGGWGIYPDEGSSEILIENNVVYRCKSAGFHQHYGRENQVRNNIFAYNREYQMMRSRVEKHISFFFEGNIVYFDQGRLLGSNWTGDQFRMSRNLYWDTRGGKMLFAGGSFEDWQKAGHDAGSVVADPLFVNPGSLDFRLRPGSPALQLGFRQIDLSAVGPRAPR